MESQLHQVHEAKVHWKWFLLLGGLLIFLGGGIMRFSYDTTLFSVIVLGFFLIFAGLVQIAQAFLARHWNGLFLTLFLGILYLVTGCLCIAQPTTAAISITLWIAAFCLIAGLFKLLAAVILRFTGWKWVFFNGLITLLLGMMIYADWPLSGLWVIGLFIGVEMILSGWSWMMLAFSLRKAKHSKQGIE